MQIERLCLLALCTCIESMMALCSDLEFRTSMHQHQQGRATACCAEQLQRQLCVTFAIVLYSRQTPRMLRLRQGVLLQIQAFSTYLKRSCFNVHLGAQQKARYANYGEHHGLHGEQAKPDLQGSTAAAGSRAMAAWCCQPAVQREGQPIAISHHCAVQLTPSWRLAWQAGGSSGCQPAHCCAAPTQLALGKLKEAAGVSQSNDVQHVPSWCLAWQAGEAGCCQPAQHAQQASSFAALQDKHTDRLPTSKSAVQVPIF